MNEQKTIRPKCLYGMIGQVGDDEYCRSENCPFCGLHTNYEIDLEDALTKLDITKYGDELDNNVEN